MALLAYAITIDSLASKIVAVAAVCVALGAIAGFARQVNKIWKSLNALARLAEYELNSNGGGSLKDNAKKGAADAGKALELVEELAKELRDFRDEQREEQTNLWRAIALAGLSPEKDYSVEVKEQRT